MLSLSTKGRYATRIMVYMARKGNTARKEDIAREEGISPDYVEQILIKLKAGGLVKSHRGARGGFTLTRPPETITVTDVLSAAEGAMNLAPCDSSKCNRASVCVTRRLWQKAEEQLHRTFSETTIAQLARQAEELQEATGGNYEI